MKLEIDNHSYVMSHGKNPSGYGSWAFIITDESCGKETETIFAPASTLTDAKKWLRNWAKENKAEDLATGYMTASVAP
jgi:hypothetical protein